MNPSVSAAPKKGISGSTLKIIAIVTMFIDHVGAIFLYQPTAYYISRLIGRIAFPIFAFLLVEGFFHTKNLSKYCLRLALFALISEIPFDLAFEETPFDWSSQNVFFTLLIGVLTISVIDRAKNALADKEGIALVCCALIAAAGMFLAWFLKTDYHAVGVCVILLMYQLHSKKSILAMFDACLCLSLCLPLEISSFAAVPLVSQYNGKRGLSLKYVFYVFYPAHLLFLAFLNMRLQ